MKKRDYIVIIVVGFLLFSVAVFIFFSKCEAGYYVVISCNGEVSRTFLLSQDREEKVSAGGEAFNTIIIQDGKVEVTDASCPDHICVEHVSIRNAGESIICLPNKVVIEITEKE